MGGNATGTAGMGGSTGTSATSFGGGQGPIVGITLPLDKPSIVVYKKQDRYNKWEFNYDPVEDQMKAAASMFGGGNPMGNGGNPGGVPGGVMGGSTPQSGFGNSGSGFGQSGFGQSGFGQSGFGQSGGSGSPSPSPQPSPQPPTTAPVNPQ